MIEKLTRLIKKTVVFDLIFVFCLSLFVFGWTAGGEIIDGNDTTYPLRPIEFFEQRLYQWNGSVGAGIDFAHGSAGLVWHGLQAAIFFVGLPLWLSQKIFLFLFFNLISFSFYFFITRLTKNKIAAITGVVFYCFNSYLFNLWGNIQAASLSAYALVPLASGLFLQALDNPKKKVLWAVVFGLSSLLFSAFGMNPGVIIVVLLYAVLFLIFTFIRKVFKDKTTEGKDFIQTVFLFVFAFIIFNLYWLVPEFLSAVSRGYSLNILSQDNRGWLDFVSANTSLLKVLRMQGEWMWYTAHKGIAYLPYAEIFKNNIFFILLSFLGFFSSLAAVLKSRNRWIPFFIAILIIGVFSSVGSKPPFGYLYLFLTEKTRLLSLLRAPWYKFGLLTSLSYAVFAAFFVDIFKGRKQIFIGLFLGLLQLIYAFPLITGTVFPSNSALPFKFKVPNYVLQADEWLRSTPGDGRVVMLPRQGDLDYYKWGNSSSPFLNLLANPKPVLTEPSWTVLTDTGAGSLLKAFYDHLEEENSDQASNILGPLNVKYLLLKNDADYNFDQNFGSPEFWKEKIIFQEGLRKANSFGGWEFFLSDDGNDDRLIYGLNNVAVVPSEPYLLADYFLLDNKRVVINDASRTDLKGLNLVYGDVGFPLEKIDSFQPPPVYIRFPADHFLHSFVIKKENKILAGLTDPLKRIGSLMIFSSKRLLETERLENNSALLKKLLGSYSSDIILVRREFRGLPEEFDRKKIEVFQTCLFRLSEQKDKLNILLLKNVNPAGINMAITQNKQIAEEINQKLENLVSTAVVKKYFIKAEKEGDYRGFLLSSEVAKSLKKGQIWKIKVNGKELSATLDKNNRSWVLLDKIPLKKGNNFVEIALPFALQEKLPFVVLNKPEVVATSPFPVVSYRKINNTRYEVKIEKSEGDFVLVFSENFHPNWQANINGKNMIAEASHLRVNGFANGWIVGKKGDFEIVLEYKTQKIYLFLLLFTALLFLTGLIYLLINIVKWKKNGKYS